MQQYEESIKDKWHDVKVEIKKMWGKLTDADLDQARGDLKSLSGIIQRRYGESKESVDSKLYECFNHSWGGVKDELTAGLEKMNKAIHEAEENSKQKF